MAPPTTSVIESAPTTRARLGAGAARLDPQATPVCAGAAGGTVLGLAGATMDRGTTVDSGASPKTRAARVARSAAFGGPNGTSSPASWAMFA
jgi:hypothetical protein